MAKFLLNTLLNIFSLFFLVTYMKLCHAELDRGVKHRLYLSSTVYLSDLKGGPKYMRVNLHAGSESLRMSSRRRIFL